MVVALLFFAMLHNPRKISVKELTFYEFEQFEIAFKHIMSVAICYDKYKNHTDFTKIRIGRDPKSGMGERVPTAYFAMAMELAQFLAKKYDDVTPMSALSTVFTPINKPKAIRWLIEYCYAHKVQPRAFEITSLVWVQHDYYKPIPTHVTIEYGAAS